MRIDRASHERMHDRVVIIRDRVPQISADVGPSRLVKAPQVVPVEVRVDRGLVIHVRDETVEIPAGVVLTLPPSEVRKSSPRPVVT